MVAAALPDLGQLDREALKSLIVEQHMQQREAYSSYQEALSAQHEELHSHIQQIEHLKMVIEKLRRMVFGAKSEKVSIQLEQLELYLEELQTAQAAAEVRVEPIVAAPKSRPSRKPLPEHLPREVVTHHPEHVFSEVAAARCATSEKT